jgi:hypothetical protein
VAGDAREQEGRSGCVPHRLLVDYVRTAPEQDLRETAEQMEGRLREQAPPSLNEMPGGLAYRGPQDLRPAGTHRELEKVGMKDPFRPAPPVHADIPPPFEPPPSPVTKAGIAWRPPPAGDPEFMHSDEKPEDARVPETGDGNG